MRKIRTSPASLFPLISLMLLAGLLMFCGSVQAQITAAQPSSQISPDMTAKLQRLQSELWAKGHSFKVGYSPAMERAASQLGGLVVPKNWRKHSAFERMEAYLSELPPSFDWRTQGGDTPVRDQGSCGGCWAFGTVGPLEILISAQCRRTVDLSEQYLVSCNENGWGCGGGWFAHDYHQWYIPATKNETDFGAVNESDLPYQGAGVPCSGPHDHPYKINSWSYIAGYTVPSVTAVKQAIQTYGPVAAGVCFGSTFQAYKSGIFDYNETCSGDVNHAITLVGWNDDLGPDNGYWILKNSWGTAWGESGYMRIRYGTSMVGYGANYIDFTDCPDLPPGLDLGSALPVTPGTLYQGQTTTDGPANVNTYGCTSRVESGPEKVYKVTTTASGNLTATLSDLGTTDLDVLIVTGSDPASCVAFGETAATYANAQPGTYYVVVDGNNGAMGAFDLKITLVQPLPDLTGTWTTLTSTSKGKTVNGTLKVSNLGNAYAGLFYVAYYLSNDGKTASQLLKTATVSSGLGAGLALNLSFNYSSSTSLSKKYIIAKIDYNGRIVESSETNNSAAGRVP
jgi:C1A family cysteine protease